MSDEARPAQDRFTPQEWRLLLRLPQWVAKAASASQPDNARRTAAEAEAGLVLISFGRESGDPLVIDISAHIVGSAGGADERAAAAEINFSDLATGIDEVLARTQRAMALLDAKVDAESAQAYRRWLTAIADVVVKAARSGDVLGIGGVLVTKAEHSFFDRLVSVLRGGPSDLRGGSSSSG